MNWLGRILGHRGVKRYANQRARPKFAPSSTMRRWTRSIILPPSTRIYHVQLILQHLGDLTEKRARTSAAARGASRESCGPIPVRLRSRPRLAGAMLACVPPGIHRCAATMRPCRLPTASCDGGLRHRVARARGSTFDWGGRVCRLLSAPVGS